MLKGLNDAIYNRAKSDRKYRLHKKPIDVATEWFPQLDAEEIQAIFEEQVDTPIAMCAVTTQDANDHITICKRAIACKIAQAKTDELHVQQKELYDSNPGNAGVSEST